MIIVSNPAKYQQRFIGTAIIVWSIISFIYSIILTGILKTYNITTAELVADAIINNLLLTGSCWLIVNNMRYYLPRREKYWYVLMISFGLSSVCIFVSRLILWLIFKKDDHYSQVLSASSGLRFGILFLLISCMSLVCLLWYTQEEQKMMNERKADSERLAREAELSRLRQQLQPHFLFNSLNSISALTGSQPEKARHMIQQLSDFLRGTLKKDDQQWNTLEEELQNLSLYLDIEKVRIGHRLQTEIICTREALPLKLPSLLLQPLVENTIKFGLYDTTGEVLIRLEAIAGQNFLQVSIQNPFDPETSQPLKGTGFGLSSVQRRLFLLFARQDLLKINKEEKIFSTTLLIPQI